MQEQIGEQPYDIYKAAGLIIQNRKVLATRSKGKHIYVQPGGKLEQGETEFEALKRELFEELGITITEDGVEKVGDFYAVAAGSDNKRLKLAAYIIKKWDGEITPQSEVEEVIELSTQIPEGIEVASILLHDLLPILKARDLID